MPIVPQSEGAAWERAERSSQDWSLPIRLESTRQSQLPQPVTLGIPFPKGVLTDTDKLTLVDSGGKTVPLQTQPLASWSDGSVKWLLLDTIVFDTAAGTTWWNLRQGGDGGAAHRGTPLSMTDTPDAMCVETGTATFHVHKHTLQPITQVVLGNQSALDEHMTRTVITAPNGETASGRIEQMTVEVRGPVRATVRLQGRFPGAVGCRFVARLCFFRDTGLVRIRLTIHNPNRAKHRGGLWDLGDRGSMWFRDLSLQLGLKPISEHCVLWVAEIGQVPHHERGARLEIYQDSSGGENWRSVNHQNSSGAVPSMFRGYHVRMNEHQTFGQRASPVVSIRNAMTSLTAAIPVFWQQFPKAIESDGHVLRIRLFPQQCADLFELQGGEQKTHTLWVQFDSNGHPLELPLSWVHSPIRAYARPEWYAASGTFPDLFPVSTAPDSPLEALLSTVVDGENSFFARREIIDEYGWRNFGDVYADHEAAYYDGPSPVISHYNNQYDAMYGLILQFLRTGDQRWYDLLTPLARHVIDIDIYHTNQDRPAYNGGLFWHTDHYLDAKTSTHRGYSRANRRSWRHRYGGGPSCEHNYTTGLLHYYYLTGDLDGRDAVIGLANWVLNMDDGRLNTLGFLDDGPTGLATNTSESTYHGPGRGAANSIAALVDAWLISARHTYLDRAESLIRRSIHPADDVTARDLLNAEKRWSYTMFLTILGRYLSIKSEAGELDFMYAYAQASLVRYATWMVENEVLYLDHPEKLEYPTETWAAQELRKANVLRLAASHVDDPLRRRMLNRAKNLAEGGWQQLLRFDSRSVARAVAIVLVEGTRDAYFRLHEPTPAPHAAEHYEFGRPQTFVPQRQRVMTQLRTWRGLTRVPLRLLDIRKWRMVR